MKVSAQQLHVDTASKTADLQGYKGGARAFLRAMAADLIKADGSVKSGYLKLKASGDEVSIKSNHIGGGATAATDLIKKLVEDAYGREATAALTQYLQGKGKAKIGTLSFVKLIKDLEADTSALRRNEIDTKLRRAEGLEDASLRTTHLKTVALKPDIAILLGTDSPTASNEDSGPHEESWEKGLTMLFTDGDVKRLGSGGEGTAYEVIDQGAPHIYKGYRNAIQVGFGPLGAREGDIGAAYSRTLLRSPHLAAPSHYILGTGREGTQPEVVLKLPADRVKELVKATHQGDLPGGLRLFGVLMPKAEGSSLNLLPEPFSAQQTSHIAASMYKGLTEMASHRTIHNDIKPENVLMDPVSGAVKFIDFGGLQKLSKSATPDSPLWASKTSLAETPAYRAPWVDGQVKFGPEVDRYAFGATMLAMALKEMPSEGPGETPDIQQLEHALAGFGRPPERPEELLKDVLERIKSKNQPLAERLQAHLDARPEFSDFLEKLFASSLPGDASERAWTNLETHPFLALQAG